MEYVDHPRLHQRGAEDFIKVLDEIPDPIIRWGNGIETGDEGKAHWSGLTRSQQKRLFLAYNYARMKGEDVSAIEDRIFRINFGLVVHAVAKYVGRNCPDLDDLVAEGSISMLKSIRKFDLRHGYLFSTYASKSMWYMCISYWRRNAKRDAQHEKFMRTYLATQVDVAPEHDGNIEWVEKQLSFNEPESMIYRMRLTNPDPVTLERLADMLDMSKEGVRHIEKRVRRQIQELFE